MNPTTPNPAQQAMQQQQQPPDPNAAPSAIDMLNQKTQQGDQVLAQEQGQLSNSQQASVSRAMGILKPNSSDKMSQVGQSIATPAYAGRCLQWVDDQQGATNRQPTAYADYQVKAQQGDIQTNGTPPKGARVYFQPDASNGNMGHVGISTGSGSFTSATDNGVKTYSLKDWSNFTGQKFIGWAK